MINDFCSHRFFSHPSLEADLGHFLIGVGTLGTVQPVEVLALHCLAAGALTDGSDFTIFARINLLHQHPVQADLSNFLIGGAAPAFALRPAVGSL